MSDDPALVSRAASGDRASFRALYEKHRGNVARLVYRMLNGAREVDDVVQEVFLQVHRSIKDFNGQSKFSTWLHRVTINVVLMHRRAAKSRPVFAGDVAADMSGEDALLPDEDAARRERIRAFGRLLERLAEKKRVVFILHELEGLPPTEIAEIVGAPVLTVRTRLFYARRELEEMLKEEPSLAALELSFTGGPGSGGDP